MWLQACLNGNRSPSEHPALPLTVEQAAQSAAAVQQAGAAAIHIHPRDKDGLETLAPREVDVWIKAIRQSCPTLPVGISSGFWILPDIDGQLAAAQGWQFKPDFVSVNWHEPHATALAEELLGLGIGIEAGLWHEEGAEQFLKWPKRDSVTRILLELPDEPKTEQLAHHLISMISHIARPILLHGEGRSAWPLVKEAWRLKMQARIGLEDTLTHPDGTLARDNAELVHSALNL